MKELLLDNYVLITYSVEVIAALIGVFLFKKYKKTKAKFFIFFLVYLTIGDILNLYTWLVYPNGPLKILIGTLIEKNYWWSTLFWKIGAIMFFAFYYQKIIKNKLLKNIIKYSGYTFLIFSITYILMYWEAFFVSYFPIISVLGAVIVFICSVFYFIEILQDEKIITFYKSLDFYVTSAIFIWWLIITPIVFYDNYTSYSVGVYERDWDYIKLRRLIYLSANILMYSTFTFALVWCRPEND